MKVRKLVWKKTYDNTINNGRIHLEEWKSEGKYDQTYHVGSTVSKKIFYSVPSWSQEAYTLHWHISRYRRQCSSIEEGKKLCEEHWQKFVQDLLED